MTPERWQRIDDLFHQALGHPPEARPAFLDASCDGDADLRAEVEALLQADDQSLSVLDASRGDLAALLPAADAGDAAHVGPYRLLEKIGQGGMGIVYLAERADGQFSKRVALKLIKRGMDTDEILRRFRHERQILARLEHPHIARLYDGGVTDDGRPYLVMEYVAGLPIDQFCDARTLTVEARLRLFEAVGEAVQYAHQNLVVHRDLKPSNILVTAAGTVKLLDFGIAKLLSDDESALTRTGMRVMTPEYGAPEQQTGAPVTTATDGYALGVVLYELLTGRRPSSAAHPAPTSAAPDAAPERPSTVVTRATTLRHRDGATETVSAEVLSARRATSVQHLKRRLRGDLDTILLKALRTEPSRRYASAEAFVEDIKRHLAGLPVQAQTDTLRYRAQKFVRRHRVGVAVAVAFVVLLAGSAAALALQQAATARERDRATQERDKAETVALFLQALFDASDPFLATTERLDTLRLRDFLDHGAAKVQREMQEQPALQADMLDVIGNVYQSLGLYDRATPLLTQSLAQRRALYGPAHPDVAESLQSLAKLYLATSAYETAEQHFRQALAVQQQEHGPDALETAHTRAGLASVLRNRSHYDEAERLLQQTLAIQRTHRGDAHLDVATSMLELGRVYQDRGNLAQAESLYRDVLGRHRALLGNAHPQVANSLDNLSIVLRQQTKLAEAEPLLREAMTLRQQVLGPEHPQTLSSLYELASLLRDQGYYEEAVDLFRQVLALDRKILGARHHYVGLDLRELGITFARMTAYDDALEAYQASLAILHDVLPANHMDISVAITGIGHVYLQKGDVTRAEPILREALQMRLATLGEDSWQTGVSKSVLGECLMRQGRHAEAERLLLEGYHTLRDGQGPTETALRRLVTFYETLKQADQAAEYRALLAALPG